MKVAFNALFALLLFAAPVLAAEPAPCGATPGADCLRAWCLERLDADAPREALDALKAARGVHGEAGWHALLMARAYLGLDNKVWARRVLAARMARAPEDCEARQWLAWVQIADADLVGGAETLEGNKDDCPRDGDNPERARAALFEAFIASQGETPDDDARAEAALARVRESERLYAEDDALLDKLQRVIDPSARPPLALRLDSRMGWTSNALLGSPLDPGASSGDFASGLGELALWGAFTWPTKGLISPFVEAEVKGQGFQEQEVQDLSYVSFALRPGLAWRLGLATLRTAYRLDAVLLSGGDRYGAGPLWFYQGHRGELELELGSALTVFGGAGHRSFRDLGRTRVESDFGLGGGGALGSRVFLLGAMSGRVFRATNAAWSLWGMTALASANLALPAKLSARALVSLSLDDYPDSAGFFDEEARRDWNLKQRIELWSPSWAGVRLGASYQWAQRWSRADRFSFTDHRVLGLLRFAFKADPWRPRTSRPEGHIALDYGLDAEGGGLGERLQDLLRQDEDAQRGSSCID
jgi:hypothetical protein